MAAAGKSLSALLQQNSIDDHEDVLKACNTALKTSRNDPQLLHVRLVALLKLDRYDDALRLLDESGDRLKERAKVERAYALYKTGNLEEAKSLANGIVENRGAMHIEAQASYRSEDFSNAASLYKDLTQSQVALDDEESDLRINSGATDAQLEWTGQGGLVERKKPAREDLEAFETAYNAACASIARGELAQGEVLLRRAKDLCMSFDEFSDKEKTAEILPISVQQLYVFSLLGKAKDADDLVSTLSTQDISDISTQMVAQNNVVASQPADSNPYLNRRLLNVLVPLADNDQLFSYQADRLQQNNLALELLARKPNSVVKGTKSVLTESLPTTSSHVNSLSVLNAAANAQGELAKFGLKQILPLFDQRPTDVGLAMTIIQLYVLTNNHGSAITVLDKLLSHLSESTTDSYQEVRYAPGLVALQVSLYSTQNRKSQIKTALAKAASYWRHKSKPPTSLLEAAGISLLDSPKPEHQELARGIFSTLHSAEPSSKLATAGFIASHSRSLPDAITPEDISTLPPLEEQISGIDISALEEAGVPILPTKMDGSSTNRKRPLEEKTAPIKKRHRKARLPKDHDPSKKPDPERWLPLRERSSYKPKKKGKRREGERERTQGGLSEKTVEKGAEVVKGSDKPSGAGGGGGKNKGKKKGKK